MYPVAFIGNTKYHMAFANAFKKIGWDFQSPVETLEELEEIFSGDGNNQKLSSETGLFIFSSDLYERNPEGFLNSVTFFVPYATVCVLVNEKKKDELTVRIGNALKSAQIEKAGQDRSYNPRTPFYIITTKDPESQIYDALIAYSKSSDVAEEIRNNVAKIIPNIVNMEYEDDEDIQDDKIDYSALNSERGDGQVIAITSSKGGSGKSTMSILFGSYLVKASKEAVAEGKREKPIKVCIVDLDTRDGQLGLLNGITSPNAMDIFMTHSDINPTTVETGIWKNSKTDVDYIFAPKRPRSATSISNQRYLDLIIALKQKYDVILLDTSVNYMDPLLESVAYPVSDIILLVTDLVISSVCGLTRWISEETGDNGAKVPLDKVGAILNKVLPDVNMPMSKIEKALGDVPVLAMIPSLPSNITFAANSARLHEMLDNNTPLLNQFKDLTDSILENPIES